MSVFYLTLQRSQDEIDKSPGTTKKSKKGSLLHFHFSLLIPKALDGAPICVCLGHF